jgi:hypothetical protein
MTMKQHILMALREGVDRWQELLAGLSEAQITAPHLYADWSIKDVIAHLWAWQQRSIEHHHLDHLEPLLARLRQHGNPEIDR